MSVKDSLPVFVCDRCGTEAEGRPGTKRGNYRPIEPQDWSRIGMGSLGTWDLCSGCSEGLKAIQSHHLDEIASYMASGGKP